MTCVAQQLVVIVLVILMIHVCVNKACSYPEYYKTFLPFFSGEKEDGIQTFHYSVYNKMTQRTRKQKLRCFNMFTKTTETLWNQNQICKQANLLNSNERICIKSLTLKHNFILKRFISNNKIGWFIYFLVLTDFKIKELHHM